MNDFINNYQIVVARYNEDIDWLKKFKLITLIYNKGNVNNQLNDFNVINLPNFGRESHTYLYHIINNYDNLKEYTIFFQGSLDFSNEIKHSKLNIEDYFQNNDFNANLKKIKFEDLKNPIQHFGKWKNEFDSGLMRKSNFTCYQWLKKFMDFDDINIEYLNVTWGAMFSVKKSIILKKPKIFYEDLLRFVDYHNNPEEGHFFERSWYFILHNEYLKKNKINVIKFDHAELDKIKNQNEIYHYWINLNQFNNYNQILNDIIIFPNYYFKIYKYNFHFKFNNAFYIKFELNNENILFLVLTPNLENNFVVLNNNIIQKIKNNIKTDYNNFNFIIESNILKIFINYELYLELNIESYQIENINDIPIYIKTNNYQNNIKLNNNLNVNNNNLKFIILENNYYDIKCFYTQNFLNYFIQYIKH